MKKNILIGILLLLVANLFAMEVKISGDSRVRPRYDLKQTFDNDGELLKKYGDLYYHYRIRLNFSASIGKEYFLKFQLGHNSP
ncbi:MAG: hypothetical protein U9R41_07825, partial [Candidatus Marinimicrobia bacterium]|nr:hypothetical protein [Candidatus Neomarinimicrobiota bacterium]